MDIQPIVKVSVERREPSRRRCTLLDRVTISQGTTADYKRLAAFHYRATGVPPGVKAVYAARDDSHRVIGVIVYARPSLNLGVRNQIFGDRYRCSGGSAGVNDIRSARLNAEFELIMRVVVHPTYRGVGLGVRLIADTMPLRNTRYIEMSAAMGAFNPFARHAGMTPVKVATSKYTARILGVLSSAGIDSDDIGNPAEIIRKVQNLPGSTRAWVMKELQTYEMRWVRGRSGRRVNFTLDGVAGRIAANAMLASTYFIWQNHALVGSDRTDDPSPSV